MSIPELKKRDLRLILVKIPKFWIFDNYQDYPGHGMLTYNPDKGEMA